DGTVTFTPGEHFNGEANFTYTVTDGELTSNVATVTVDVDAVNDAPIISQIDGSTVSEEGLDNANRDNDGDPTDVTNSTVFTGTYSVSDADGDVWDATFTNNYPTGLTSGDVALVYERTNDGHTLTGFAGSGGEAIIQVDIVNDGTYKVTLLGPLDHPVGGKENLLSFDVDISVDDLNGGINTGSIPITVEDDSPLSGDIYQSVVIPPQNTNLMFIIDTSGSMDRSSENGEYNGPGLTRMELLLDSVANVINKYDAFGDVKIQIVTFSSGSDSNYRDEWMTVDEALKFIGEDGSHKPDALLTPEGSTDYDLAVRTAKSGFEQAGKIVDSEGLPVTNVSYFLSDGQPTTGGANGGSLGIIGDEVTLWTSFLEGKHIDSYAVGFGSGLDQRDRGFLDPLAYDGMNKTERDGVIVEDASTLSDTLLSTIDQPVMGSILGNVESNGLGADDGDILSITIDGVKYEWNGSQITPDNGGKATAGSEITIPTGQNGVLTIDFATGEYKYLPDSNMQLDTAYREVFNFVVEDNDGDKGTGTVTLNIGRGIDSDNDGVIDAVDIDDDNDGIVDLNEGAFVDSDVTIHTEPMSIAGKGGTTTQNINLSGYGINVGDYITISDLYARGDADGGVDNFEFFNLTINGTSVTGLQTPSQGPSNLPDRLHHILRFAPLVVQVQSDSNGDPVLTIVGQTGSEVKSQGIEYRFDITHSISTFELTADTDHDGIMNILDTDSDNDGIPDNVEAQDNSTHVAPSGIDADHDGLDDAYAPDGLKPLTTGNAGPADFLNTDSNEDGVQDGKADPTNGDDRLVGGDGSDTLEGQDGNDFLFGQAGDDTLHGGEGDDVIDGGAGRDSIYGDVGDDTIFFDSNDAHIDGGSGTDTLLISDAILDFSSIADITIKNIERLDLNAPEAQEVKLTLDDVLDMSGTTGTTHVLEVAGGEGDKVTFDTTGWSNDGNGLFSKAADTVQIVSDDSDANRVQIFTDDGTEIG
ncbi:cadherin-like domain-containing protein, partial [Desulfopila aestuarii]